MNCDMCNKQATMIAKVEGAQISVCDTCGSYGTVVRRLAPVQNATKKTSALPTTNQREEYIDAVRPDTSKLIRNYRAQHKLSHEQFAAQLNIRLSTYQHYESGTTLPDIENAKKISHVIGTPLVVKIKIEHGFDTEKNKTRGLELGDFIKKIKKTP